MIFAVRSYRETLMHELQMIGWKLDHIGMSPSAESYLVLHRFGPVRFYLIVRNSAFHVHLQFGHS